MHLNQFLHYLNNSLPILKIFLQYIVIPMH